jgi:peptidoglycan/xylan/chitin deacetylase (PgdA/CDA1 family)
MPALMYHDVVPAGSEDSSGFPGRDAALYKVTPERFGAHLDAIASTVPAVAITIDDGGGSALLAADALEHRRLRGLFFITSRCIGTRGFVDRAGIRELHQRGHIVGSHSCSHPLRMGHLPTGRILHEWTESRLAIGDLLGANVWAASVPGGDFAPQVALAAAEAGFTLLFTSEPTRFIWRAGPLTLCGRFTIRRWMSAGTAAALAAGAWLPCARQAALWNAKKIGKRLGGERYLQFRKLLLRHDDQVHWGDQL